MNYKDGLVAFIDILGTKNYSFEKLKNINEIFHKSFETSNEILSPNIVAEKYSTSFSDCAYIVNIIRESHEKDKDKLTLPVIHGGIWNIMYHLIHFALNDFLCRGGISYGNIYYEKEKNILFGTAVNEAYNLECEADMPRIIINKELAEKVIEHQEEMKSSNLLASLIYGNLIIQDSEYDNRYFLNYLNAFYGYNKIKIDNEIYTFETFYNIVKKYSENTIKNTDNYNIISKHLWQIKYLDKMQVFYKDISYIEKQKKLLELINNKI